jgi:hypothetical protein
VTASLSRSRIEDAADQKGEDKVAAAIVTRAKTAVEADIGRAVPSAAAQTLDVGWGHPNLVS